MPPRFASLTRLLSLHFIWLLLGCYALAIAFPGPGNWVRETVIFQSDTLGVTIKIPLLLLSVLFVDIGMHLARQGRHSHASASSIGIVVAAGWLIPVLLLFVTGSLFGHAFSTEGHQLFLGLLLVAAMPIANSSSAWAHNLGADVGHSVLAVIWSTLLAPIVSVLVVTWLWLDGSPASELRDSMSVQIFAGLIAAVVLPIALGAGIARLYKSPASPSNYAPTSDLAKLVNMTILLILNYSNAALAMPQAFGERKFGPLLLAFACVAILCGCLLLSARLISRLMKWPMPLATSAALSMSMKNTGTALVLAGGVLPQGSMAILVIVGYTLVQHMLVSVTMGPVNLDAQSQPVEPAVLERLRQDSEPPLLTASHIG